MKIKSVFLMMALGMMVSGVSLAKSSVSDQVAKIKQLQQIPSKTGAKIRVVRSDGSPCMNADDKTSAVDLVASANANCGSGWTATHVAN